MGLTIDWTPETMVTVSMRINVISVNQSPHALET